jgi:Uncharacterised protein family (UPF0158)
MAHDEWRKGLRVAAAQHDAAAIVRLLGEQLPAEGLQHAGDAVLCALAVDLHAARDVAARVADALRERSWDGDEELADAIGTVLGQRVTTLTRLDVDLDFIADALTEPAGSVGYLDLHTGFVTTEAMLDNGDADDNPDLEDRSRWLPVAGEGSDAPYQVMRRFIATVPEPRLAHQLTAAIDGRGAFRRFYGVIATAPDEHTRWQRYTDDARLGRARSWLADRGYQPEIR